MAAIVSGLCVKVSYVDPTSQKVEIHAGVPGTNPNNEALLAQISFISSQQHNPNVSEYIKNNHQRLRSIKHDNRIIGIAALSTNIHSGSMLLGLKTTGGLATAVQSRHVSHYIGYLDHKPASAKREAWSTKIDAPEEIIKEWAVEQLKILESENIGDFEMYIAGHNACEFGIDPIEISKVMIIENNVQKFVTYDELASIVERVPIGIIKSKSMEYADIYYHSDGFNNMALIKPITQGKYLSLERDKQGNPVNPNSIIGCLCRAMERRKQNPMWKVIPAPFRFHSNFGALELLILSTQ